MSQDRIKSAWEIALEKAERMGKLSPEEAKKRQEEEYLPRGHALAEKYIKGLPLRDLEMELKRYEREREVVRKGMMVTFVSAISLEGTEQSSRALEGLILAGDGPGVLEIKEKISSLLKKYNEARESLFKSSERAIAEKVKAQLEKEGLTGSSLKVNALASQEWQEASEKLRAEYLQELNSLKKKLIE